MLSKRSKILAKQKKRNHHVPSTSCPESEIRTVHDYEYCFPPIVVPFFACFELELEKKLDQKILNLPDFFLSTFVFCCSGGCGGGALTCVGGLDAGVATRLALVPLFASGPDRRRKLESSVVLFSLSRPLARGSRFRVLPIVPTATEAVPERSGTLVVRAGMAPAPVLERGREVDRALLLTASALRVLLLSLRRGLRWGGDPGGAVGVAVRRLADCTSGSVLRRNSMRDSS
jgi:hypothetical protein